MRSFCPRCRCEGSGEETSCFHCGDTLVPQGYCDVCEKYWPLPVGSSCPKHDVALEPDDGGSPDALGEEARGAKRWVTVATFADDVEAEAPRLRLEAEGVPTFLEGARMGSRSMYQVATGGVKLQVPEPLGAEARVLLSQSWTFPADDLDDAWDELIPEPGVIRRRVMKGLIVLILASPFVLSLIALIIDLCISRR
jgi:hypothetical protein